MEPKCLHPDCDSPASYCSLHSLSEREIESHIAAARLAGRLEQADRHVRQISDLGPPSGETNGEHGDGSCCDGVFHHLREMACNERDRLRAEVEKENK